VEVPASGKFKVSLYYTCPEGDQGSVIQLSVGENRLEASILEAHDPPLRGMKEDLSPRVESYVKDWKVADIGSIRLTEGEATMALKALSIAGSTVMDFRLLLFERLEEAYE
jgi:hypothetical protein